MELILKEDVQNLGFKDEIVRVKNGYGRNFLIPQGKAVMATLSARKILAENLKQRAFKEKSIIDAAQAIAEKIKALEIKVPSKVGSGDKLFGSVTNRDLLELLKENGFELERRAILLNIPIRNVGTHEFSVRVHTEVTVTLQINVIGETVEVPSVEKPTEDAADEAVIDSEELEKLEELEANKDPEEIE